MLNAILYCVKFVLCQNCCQNVDNGQIGNFNASDDMFFYYNDCSHDQYCNACGKICEDDCIMCNSCRSWVHYKCSKLTKKQTNRYHQTTDKYYCQNCISQTLPFNAINNTKLNNLNHSDSVLHCIA